jgi:hypothetical protein
VLLWWLWACLPSKPELNRGVFDEDGDGVAAAMDCDDADATVWSAISGYVDADGDGFGAGPRLDCVGDLAWVAEGSDCDDGDATAWLAGSFYTDGDGDGFGAGAAQTCVGALDGLSTDASDCDDADPAVWAVSDWFPDVDGDGFGAETAPPEVSCGPPATGTWAGAAGDCDDAHPRAFPGAPEDCGVADLNCVGGDDPLCRLSGAVDFEAGEELDGALVNAPVELGDDPLADFTLVGDFASVGGNLVAAVRSLDGAGAIDGEGRWAALGQPPYIGLLPHQISDVTGDGLPETFLVLGDFNDPSAVWWLEPTLPRAGGPIVDLDGLDPWLDRSVGLTDFAAVGRTFQPGDLTVAPGLEVVIGALDDGLFNAVRGRAEIWVDWGGTPTEAVSITSPDGTFFGEQLVVADLDGDGLDDIAGMTTPADVGNPVAATALIFHGPFSADRATEDADLLAGWDNVAPGARGQVAAAGDLLGDGRSWLWFAAPGTTGFPGRLYALPGESVGASPVDAYENRRVSSADTAFGSVLGVVGDQTGDGVADPLLATPNFATGETLAWLLDSNVIAFSGTTTFDSLDPALAPGLVQAEFVGPGVWGSMWVDAGDQDGDGWSEVAASGYILVEGGARLFTGGQF